MAVGVAPSGAVILSLMIDKGAALSYQLDPAQGREMLNILQDALGDGAAPPKAEAESEEGKSNEFGEGQGREGTSLN